MSKIKFIVLFFLIFTFKSESSVPDFVWQKKYDFETIKFGLNYDFQNIDDYYYCFIQGQDKSDIGLMGSCFMKINTNGNLIFQKEYLQKNSYLLQTPSIRKINDSIKIAVIYNLDIFPSNLDTAHSRFCIYSTDIDGEYNTDLPDTMKLKKISSPANPNFFNDSVYIGNFRPMTTTRQQLLVFDNKAEFIREINLDTNGLNDLINNNSTQYHVLHTKDSCLLTHFNSPFSGLHYILFCKYDLNGKLKWKTKVENSEFDYTTIYFFHQLSDGSFFIEGNSYLYNNQKKADDNYFFIARISENGELLMKKNIKFKDFILSYGHIKAIKNGDFYVLYDTYVNKDISDEDNEYLKRNWIAIIDKEGEFYDEYIWSYDSTKSNYIAGVIEKENSNLVLMGKNGWNSVYFAEIRPKFTSIENESKIFDKIDVKITPNPASDIINIQIKQNKLTSKVNCKLFDLSGVEILNFDMYDQYNLDLSKLQSGSYYIQIIDSQNNTITKKINIIR